MNIQIGILLGLSVVFADCKTEIKTNNIFIELYPDNLILDQKTD